MRKLCKWSGIILFLGILSVLILIPVLWVFVNSVKSSAEILLEPLALPSKLEFGNFSKGME